ncbi:MAG: hypothetical protein ACLQA5_04490 [Solirubrobacteraceae bacterium]
MTMLTATYSFFVKAAARATHVVGIDVATPDGNVTLAEGHAR